MPTGMTEEWIEFPASEFTEGHMNDRTITKSNEVELLPPWLEFPEYTSDCMGWRMGDGEDYMVEWLVFFYNLPENAKNNYKQKYPVPSGYADLYMYKFEEGCTEANVFNLRDTNVLLPKMVIRKKYHKYKRIL